MKTMLNEPYNKTITNFQVLYIQLCVHSNMLVEAKLAMIHLNVPNLFYLFTIYSITHIGTYMRRLTATRLNQNVLRSVDFYAIPPVLHVMVYHQGIYELKIPGFSVHF